MARVLPLKGLPPLSGLLHVSEGGRVDGLVGPIVGQSPFLRGHFTTRRHGHVVHLFLQSSASTGLIMSVFSCLHISSATGQYSKSQSSQTTAVAAVQKSTAVCTALQLSVQSRAVQCSGQDGRQWLVMVQQRQRVGTCPWLEGGRGSFRLLVLRMIEG